MTCLHEGPFIVILSLGLGLSFEPLTTFWMVSIFLFGRFGNASLIFSIFIAMSEDNALDFDLGSEAWAYNLFVAGFSIFLKNFKISLTSLFDLAGIGGWNDWYKWWFGYFFTFVHQRLDILDLKRKFGLDFTPKSCIVVVDIQRVLVGIIYCGNEFPNGFTHAIQVLKIISFVAINRFTSYEFLHSGKWCWEHQRLGAPWNHATKLHGSFRPKNQGQGLHLDRSWVERWTRFHNEVCWG